VGGIFVYRGFENCRAVLLDGFREHGGKLAEGLGTNDGTAGAGILEWTRPHTKWRKAQLELLPGEIEGADTASTRMVGIAIAS
jgi:hypothetical protein